jgi:hypothetical protein
LFRAGEAMKNNIAVTAIITAGIVVLVIHFTPRPQPKTVASAPVTPGMSQSELFSMNGKCAGLADKLDESEGVHGAALQGSHTSHYNPRTNHCYLQETSWKNFHFEYIGKNKYTPVPEDYWSEALFDAQTGDVLMSARRLHGPPSESGIDWTAATPTHGQTFNGVREKIDKLMHEGEVKP